MASKFKTGHTIPPEYPDILKDFVREVLREQPANIFSFGAVYFQNKSDEGGGGEGGGIGGMTEEALVEYLTNLFVQADVDKNGVLDKAVRPSPPSPPAAPRLAPLRPAPPPLLAAFPPPAARRVGSAFASALSSNIATLRPHLMIPDP